MSTVNVTPAAANLALSAGHYDSIFTAPIGCIEAVVNVRLVSRDLAQNIKTRMAIVPSWAGNGGTQAPADSTYVQPVDLVLGPAGIVTGIIEDTSIVLSPGESVVVYADKSLVSARLHGLVRTLGA